MWSRLSGKAQKLQLKGKHTSTFVWKHMCKLRAQKLTRYPQKLRERKDSTFHRNLEARLSVNATLIIISHFLRARKIDSEKRRVYWRGDEWKSNTWSDSIRAKAAVSNLWNQLWVCECLLLLLTSKSIKWLLIHGHNSNPTDLSTLLGTERDRALNAMPLIM